MCLTLPRPKRFRCRSITHSASATPIRYSEATSTAFSNLDSVGCEASAAPLTGSRPTRRFWIGSSASRAASLPSVTTGNRIQPLAHQIGDRVIDLARLPPIHDAVGQTLRQTQPIIASLQQNRSAIGTAVALVKLRHQRAAKQVGKQNTLCCAIVSHAKASRVVESLVAKPFYHDRGFCLLEIHELFRLGECRTEIFAT